MEQFVKQFKEEIGEFRKVTEQFYAKEVSVKDYKGFSGKYGSYAQKGAQCSMLRLRLPGGRIPKDRLKFLADSIRKYDVKKAHFTTCQTVQFHDLNVDAVCGIMEEAISVGILTKGGGGDFPRNVMCSPLSGVEKGEYFDVMPYALATSDYALGFIDTVKMPRKLKVCFSNSPANESHATFRDLGFVAREDQTFDVYVAGGLGNNPRMGVLVAEGVDPNLAPYYVKAMVRTFVENGNYENRGKARTRYMQETLGEEGLKEAYLANLDKAMEEGGLKLAIQPEGTSKQGDGSTVEGFGVIPQKQEGLYAVAYHPIGGMPPVDFFGRLYDVIQDMDQVECRIAPDETLYVINLTGAEAKRVLAVTEDGARTLFETSVSCVGGTICQVGLRDSQGLLAALVKMEREKGFGDGVLPQIHISGCTSSCGTHQIGRLGFHGGVKRIGDVVEQTFTLHVNGTDQQGREQFGEQLGMMIQRQIPDFMADLGTCIAAENQTFEEWYAAHPEKLKEIAEQYLT